MSVDIRSRPVLPGIPKTKITLIHHLHPSFDETYLCTILTDPSESDGHRRGASHLHPDPDRMQHVVIVGLVAVVTAATERVAAIAPATCTSDLDCSLNGACGSGRACQCDPPWSGPTCGVLGMAPAPLGGAYG